VIAEFQTAGRGRLGRSWESERGRNLTFSVILHPGIEIARAGLVSLNAAVSVAAAVGRRTQLEPKCKWPNDLLLGAKKFCGILSEAVSPGETLDAVVVGIGVNVNQRSFPAPIAGSATSLAIEAGREFDREDIFGAILAELDSRRSFVTRPDALIAEWTALCPSMGREVAVVQGDLTLRGIAESVDPDGRLVLRTAVGPLRVSAGDVTPAGGNHAG
jgi:BirA family biotin operon repressor/biotin-[acetyl-CoA-carboxylase] ligase